jgi:hypothetical protein
MSIRRSRHQVPQPTIEEKRAEALRAAEFRQNQWKQSGNVKSIERNKVLRAKREKDELIGKLHAKYTARGEVAPFGLASCDVDTLRRRLLQFG